MQADAEKYAKEDEEFRARSGAKNELEGLAYRIKNELAEGGQMAEKVSEEDKAVIVTACDGVIEWLESNGEASIQEFEDKKKDLEFTYESVMKDAQGGEQGKDE